MDSDCSLAVFLRLRLRPLLSCCGLSHSSSLIIIRIIIFGNIVGLHCTSQSLLFLSCSRPNLSLSPVGRHVVCRIVAALSVGSFAGCIR
ncbi:hypothetical protein FA95DRAFT_345002 [Auriscalpium vulgare]|uniref:Uncharacterized protein n=1 Tax=Auriscalpium vulgare TaxID=40419 RepID=A0ACB8RJ65_9AGAM|nr:hypothetical protein FA95DRAFT_345002 [Auriscalpium vulgare]